jgi:hypothetical protein
VYIQTLARIVCCAFLALLASCVFAAADERDNESLRDLDGVRVSVDEVSLAAPVEGISNDALKKAVTVKLQQAGIRVLNQGEYPVGDPYLSVRVATTPQSSGLVAYNVEIDFVQIVFLRRNPSVTFNRSQTWKAKGKVGLVPAPELEHAIMQELKTQLDEFIRAYRSVNH